MNVLQPISPVLKKLAEIYTRREREFVFKGIKVKVLPGVFHPGLFISSKILLNFVDEISLEEKSFLELGAGTGIIAILAARKGATVYASDISRKAVENIKLNAENNSAKINVFTSDMFQSIPENQFDYIIINPPYYKKDPLKEEEYAWLCGSNLEFFKSLFGSLSKYIHNSSEVFMILSEVCDIKEIKTIGRQNGFTWNLRMKKRIWAEKNYIYNLTKT